MKKGIILLFFSLVFFLSSVSVSANSNPIPIGGSHYLLVDPVHPDDEQHPDDM